MAIGNWPLLWWRQICGVSLELRAHWWAAHLGWPFPSLPVFCTDPFLEHRGGGRRVLRWTEFWGQHQGSSDTPGPHGDGGLCQDVLQGTSVNSHLSGKLWGCWSHHHLLRGTQQKSSGSLCSHRKSKKDFEIFYTNAWRSPSVFYKGIINCLPSW